MSTDLVFVDLSGELGEDCLQGDKCSLSRSRGFNGGSELTQSLLGKESETVITRRHLSSIPSTIPLSFDTTLGTFFLRPGSSSRSLLDETNATAASGIPSVPR